MPIYLKLADIKGSVTESAHKDWIEVDSMQYGVGRAIRTPVGRATGRETGAPSLSELTFTKKLDGSSLPIFKLSVGGTTGKDATIHLVKVENDAAQTYLEVKLKDALVSAYSSSTNGAQDTHTMESFSLNFTKIDFTHKTYDKTHNVAGNFSAGFDLHDVKAV